MALPPLVAALLGAALLASPQAVTPTVTTTTKLDQTYDLVAGFNTATGALQVTETIRLTNRDTRAINAVDLSVIPRALGVFSKPQVAKVDGVPASETWTTTTNLRVRLGKQVAPGDAVTLGLAFRLTPQRETGAFAARLSRENGVSSFGEWFPIVSVPHDSYGVGDPQISFNAHRITLRLTTSTPLRRNAVACPGRIAAPASTGTHWTCRIFDVRDLGFAINPQYVAASRVVDGITIRAFTQVGNRTVILDKAAHALASFNDLYGRYPYGDLVLAEIGAQGGFSMEYPRQIHLTREKVNDTYVIYHEVAHQWFYGLLGNHQMNEPWVDEGFADFSARHLMGIGENQCSRLKVDSSVFAWPAGLTSGGNWTECEGYFHTVFYKGTEFLNAIRARMGAADFFAALRAYIAEHRYGIGTTRGLLDHLAGWDDAALLDLYRVYTTRYDPPRASPRAPRDGDQFAVTGQFVSVDFSRRVENVSTASFRLRDLTTGDLVPASVLYFPSQRRAILRPGDPLRWGRTYRASLSTAIKDIYGNRLAPTGWSFKVANGVTFAESRRVLFSAGTHTGYRFDPGGDIVGRKTATLGRDSGAPSQHRATFNGHAYLRIGAGIWASYWVPESNVIRLEAPALRPLSARASAALRSCLDRLGA